MTPQAEEDAETAKRIQQWRYSAHNWMFSSPAANAAALSLTRIVLGQDTGDLNEDGLRRVVRAQLAGRQRNLDRAAHGVQGLATGRSTTVRW